MDIAVWNSIFVAVIYFLYFAVILTTIFVVILDNRSPVKTMAWILVLFFLPVAGWILYLFLGAVRVRSALSAGKAMLV